MREIYLGLGVFSTVSTTGALIFYFLFIVLRLESCEKKIHVTLTPLQPEGKKRVT